MPATTLGVVDGDNLTAVVVFHNYFRQHGIIEISIATDGGRRWLTREVLYRMFSYPFDQLGCQLVVMRMSEKNRAIEQPLRFGFRPHRVERLLGRDEAQIILTLTDDDWRASRYYRR